MLKWIQKRSSRNVPTPSCDEYLHICCPCMEEIRNKKIHPMIIILDGDREPSVSFVSRFLSHKYLFKEHKCSIDRLVCHKDRHVIRAHELTDEEVQQLKCNSVSHILRLYIRSSDETELECCKWDSVINHYDFKVDHDYCILKHCVIEYMENLYEQLNSTYN